MYGHSASVLSSPGSEPKIHMSMIKDVAAKGLSDIIGSSPGDSGPGPVFMPVAEVIQKVELKFCGNLFRKQMDKPGSEPFPHRSVKDYRRR